MPSTTNEDLDAHAPEDADAARRAMSRRRLIRNAGIAGAAAWTAPMIVDSMSSPAAARTFPPCPDTGSHYAVVYSPPQDRGQPEGVDRDAQQQQFAL